MKFLIVILVFILTILISLSMTWLFTYGIIWALNGIFSINYWDKFWYIFCLLWISHWFLQNIFKK